MQTQATGRAPLVRRAVVVLPAFNEEANLRWLVARLQAAFADIDGLCEILVVDDGSSDRTAEIARELQHGAPVTLIQHDRNRGLGAAIRTGLLAAHERADVVVTMDADNTQDPALIRVMLAGLEHGADLVIASRYQPGGAETGVPPRRRLLSRAASWMLRTAAPLPGVRDYSCGYRAYRASLVRSLVDRFGPERFVQEGGFACMTELLLKSASVGARISEVPLALRYDYKAGSSKIAAARTARQYLALLRRYRRGFPVELIPIMDQPATGPHTGVGRMWASRALALVAIVLLSPVLVGIALLVRVTSGGPVLERDLRSGLNRRKSAGAVPVSRRVADFGGEPFQLLRFRTRAAGPDGSLHTTRTGAFLRRYRLHHLPELFNVLRGDMLLVGPYPQQVDRVAELRGRIEGYAERFSVPPGLAGAGQLAVESISTDADEEARVSEDLRYLARRSLGEDTRLLAKAVVRFASLQEPQSPTSH